MVLTTLKWDMSAVVSLDFLDHLLARLHLMLDKPSSDGCKQTIEEIRRFATDLCLMSSKGKPVTNSSSISSSFTLFTLLTLFTVSPLTPYMFKLIYPNQLNCQW